MAYQIKPLPAGLTFVATPIGAARDITLRALDVLASADVLAAEDTRSLRRLMEIHGVPLEGRPLIAYHDHNGPQARPKLLALMREGRSVAYASEAGTPLVADPGYALARAALEEGIAVSAAPGPSAAVVALSVSGLASDRFLFAGFPPAASGARRKALEELAAAPATLILFESPRRLHRTLDELCAIAGEAREAAVCRELTKRFEEVARGSLGELRDRFAGAPPKGEIVLLVDRARGPAEAGESLDEALDEALERLSVKDAAAEVAARLGLKKRDVYQAALKRSD